jgi:MoxR-like ATPase
MAEREVAVPRVGRITARPSFRIVASMNPFDSVGTMRISASFYDRLCRLAVDYQSAAEDEQIVTLRTACPHPALVADAVALTRATREHPDVRQGSSVRGAIDLVAVATSLAAIRGVSNGDRDTVLLLDAALLALSGRITLDETSSRTAEQVIQELWENHVMLGPRRAAGSEASVELPNPI